MHSSPACFGVPVHRPNDETRQWFRLKMVHKTPKHVDEDWLIYFNLF
jgi:hypothetical protein